MEVTFHNIQTDFDVNVRMQAVPIILTTIAAIQLLQGQTYSAHLNVKGDDFYQAHLLFERISNELDAMVDPLAERVTALGGTVDPQATAQIQIGGGIIPSLDVQTIFLTEDYCTALLNSYVRICKHVADSVKALQDMGDWVTSNHYQSLLMDLDHHTYFLNSMVWELE